MALLDFSTDYQKKKTLLALFGTFMMLSAAFLGCWIFAAVVNPSMALMGGLMIVIFVDGFLGFLVVLADQTAKDICIKIENEK